MKINKKNLKKYGFSNKNTIEFDWEKTYPSVRTNEDGTRGKSIFGLIKWGDGEWEVYIQIPIIKSYIDSSCALIKKVTTMEEINELYEIITK